MGSGDFPIPVINWHPAWHWASWVWRVDSYLPPSILSVPYALGVDRALYFISYNKKRCLKALVERSALPALEVATHTWKTGCLESCQILCCSSQ